MDQERWSCSKKWMCWCFNICFKRAVLGKKNNIWFSLFLLLPFFPRKHGNIWPYIYKQLFSIMVPWHLQWEDLFCLLHCKTHWTMIVDNVGLEIGLLWTSSSMVSLTLFSWSKTEVVLWQVQQSTTYFRGAREDFMVHDANNPLVSHSPFVKGLDYMLRSLKMSCLLVINMILFVNMSHFFKWKLFTMWCLV